MSNRNVINEENQNDENGLYEYDPNESYIIDDEEENERLRQEYADRANIVFEEQIYILCHLIQKRLDWCMLKQ